MYIDKTHKWEMKANLKSGLWLWTMPSLVWSLAFVKSTSQSFGRVWGSTANPWFWDVMKQRFVPLWMQGWLWPRLPYLTNTMNEVVAFRIHNKKIHCFTDINHPRMNLLTICFWRKGCRLASHPALSTSKQSNYPRTLRKTQPLIPGVTQWLLSRRLSSA